MTFTLELEAKLVQFIFYYAFMPRVFLQYFSRWPLPVGRVRPQLFIGACFPLADVLNGLLLPANVGGPATRLPGQQRDPGAQHLHVETHLEAGHLLLQWQTVLPAHHHHTQQVRTPLPGRQGPLFV
jgi:hypothetical protein